MNQEYIVTISGDEVTEDTRLPRVNLVINNYWDHNGQEDTQEPLTPTTE